MALDATHQPHITTLQRYVRTADLDRVYDAVGRTVADTDMVALSYQVIKIAHADWGFPGYGPVALQVQVSPEVSSAHGSFGYARVVTFNGITREPYLTAAQCAARAQGPIT